VVPFNQQLLAGHFARTYDRPLDECFDEAKHRIDQAIYRDVIGRIGGDDQRVHNIDSQYDAITYKHLLLPVWLLAYRFGEKPYHVFVNASTGEVPTVRGRSRSPCWQSWLSLWGLVSCVRNAAKLKSNATSRSTAGGVDVYSSLVLIEQLFHCVQVQHLLFGR
jgi:hypothetical protein